MMHKTYNVNFKHLITSSNCRVRNVKIVNVFAQSVSPRSRPEPLAVGDPPVQLVVPAFSDLVSRFSNYRLFYVV